MANYPGADPSFPTRSNGQAIDASHVNVLGDEITAIGTALRGTLQHGVTLAGGQSLNVPGASTLGTLSAGASTVATLSVSGGSTFADPVVMSSGLTLSTGNLTLGQDVSIAGKVTSALSLSNQLRLSPALSTLSGGSTRFDNVQFPSSAGVVFISGNSTTIAITGISGGTHGRVLYLVNAMGGNDVTLEANDANSSADCRFALASNTDKALGGSGSAMVVYSTVSGFWHGLASRV